MCVVPSLNRNLKSHKRKIALPALLVAQFMGAANDNILKTLLSFAVIDGIWAGELGRGGQGLIALFLFIPFILFSGWAGPIADRFSKRSISVNMKILEVPLALLGGLGFILGYFWLGAIAMVVLAIQSTFFGPAKYGMIPELVPKEAVSKANGLLNMFTNIAIIIGTLIAGLISPPPPPVTLCVVGEGQSIVIPEEATFGGGKVEVVHVATTDAYEDYLRESQEQTQNRISHFMIDKSNYESSDAARSAIDKIMTGLNAGDVSFEEVVASSSEDLVSKENQGDLGLSSGDAFPEEFELAILDLDLNDLSPIIELEDSLHILKLTEIIKPEIKSINQMEKDLISELVDAEAVALMQDDFIKLEQMVLEGVTFFELADAANQTISVTGLNDIGDTALEGFEAYSGEDLFSPDVLVNKIEIFESDNSYAFVMMTQAVESSVRAFADVAEEAIEEVRIEKAVP